MLPAPQYTLYEAIGVCLAMCHRALAEVRALARVPGPPGAIGPEGQRGPPGEKGEPGRPAADLIYLQNYVGEQVGRALKTATLTTTDGGRTLRWAIGDSVHEIKTAIVLDAGVWKEGMTYVAGDAVSCANSLWIAQAVTSAKPPSDDWRLAVRAGRNGRDYRPEEKHSPDPIRFK